MSDKQTTAEEEVGRAIREWVIRVFGRPPTQPEFEQMYFAWRNEAEKIYDL